MLGCVVGVDKQHCYSLGLEEGLISGFCFLELLDHLRHEKAHAVRVVFGVLADADVGLLDRDAVAKESAVTDVLDAVGVDDLVQIIASWGLPNYLLPERPGPVWNLR